MVMSSRPTKSAQQDRNEGVDDVPHPGLKVQGTPGLSNILRSILTD